MEKSRQKASNAGAAGRMKHLREKKFQTEGFKSNEPIPTLAAAGRMIAANRVSYNAVPRLIVRPGGTGSPGG